MIVTFSKKLLYSYILKKTTIWATCFFGKFEIHFETIKTGTKAPEVVFLNFVHVFPLNKNRVINSDNRIKIIFDTIGLNLVMCNFIWFKFGYRTTIIVGKR